MAGLGSTVKTVGCFDLHCAHLAAVCPWGCGVGSCVAPFQCACPRGYIGQFCQGFNFGELVFCGVTINSGCGSACPANTVPFSFSICSGSSPIQFVCLTTPSYYGGCCPGYTGPSSGCRTRWKSSFHSSLTSFSFLLVCQRSLHWTECLSLSTRVRWSVLDS
jgi:hypothetical protein